VIFPEDRSRDLLACLYEHPDFAEVASRLLRGKDATLQVPDAARGYFLAALSEHLSAHDQGPLFAVVSEARGAYKVAADALEFVAKPRSRSQALAGVEVFPAWESLPFEHISPSPSVMGTRIRVLWRLLHRDRSLRLVVASARSALQRIDPSCIPDKPLVFVAGAGPSLSEAVEILVSWGYQRTYQVEARGEFAVRGGILDIWPAGEEFPIRIDYFGDEIESVKGLSVATQRSATPISGEVFVFPARELRPGEEVRRRAVELMESHPENAKVWDNFSEGIYFAGMESWLAWVVPRAPTPLETFGGTTSIALCDPKEISNRADSHVAEEEDMARALLGTWQLDRDRELTESQETLDFPRLYGTPEEALRDNSCPVITVTTPASHLDSPESLFGMWPQGLRAAGLAQKAGSYSRKGWTVLIAAGSQAAARRVTESFAAEDIPAGLVDSSDLSLIEKIPGILVGPFSYSEGFVFPDAKLAILTQAELSPSRSRSADLQRAPARWEMALRSAGDSRFAELGQALESETFEMAVSPGRNRLEEFLADLEPGDHVVHYYHGIGLYKGLVTLRAGGAERDYLQIEYAGSGKLYVPTEQLDAVKKYSGGERPRLNRLGGADWAQTKRRARAAAAQVAQYLVELYRERTHVAGTAFSPDTPWQKELEDSFPYELTADQEKALAEVKADMEAPRPMDRLICGDVGFGKTEIAVRAAFKAVQDGYQVAVLVPTTLLAQQHYETFGQRFEPYPVRIGMLSRFLTPAGQREVLEHVADGSIDVIIGTHRLLQKDVSIPKLGLLIIDEEHRFGVAHKEALKASARGIDVLTLTATPIPRTLEMALSGIRDVSSIETPPPGRQPVLTYVGEYDEGAVAAAIRRELMRGGQVFYVYNRVRSIEVALEQVRRLVPSARIEVAHGQMSEHTLEKTMMKFYEGDVDVLVTTTIVESGLDIPSVNTLVVERADMLGLAELYQLRGRVGRGKDRAYAYFFYPSRRAITEEAYERLKTIGEHTDLGSGFAIARRDLEIRGAGNLLGEAQSGHIAAVGLDLYVKMVSEAVGALEGREASKTAEPVQVDIPIDAHLPKDYVSQESLRLEAYRKLAEVKDAEGIDQIEAEWRDRYGPIPPQAYSLLDVAKLKIACRAAGITECVYSSGTLKLKPLELTELQQIRIRRSGYEFVYKPSESLLRVNLRKGRCSPDLVMELLSVLERGTDPKKQNKRKKSKDRST
jgi:transcription-repair coupling factor (superfamily II helicase)